MLNQTVKARSQGKAQEIVESSKETAKAAKEGTENAANAATDNTENVANAAKDSTANISESTRQSIQQEKERSDFLHQTGEKVVNMAQGAVSSVKSTLGIGEKK